MESDCDEVGEDGVSFRNQRVSVVKTSLKKHLLAPELTLPILENAVLYVSRVSRVASQVFNITLLDVLNRENGCIPYEVDFKSSTTFNRVFSYVARGTKGDVRLRRAFQLDPFCRDVAAVIAKYESIIPKIQVLSGDRDILREAALQYKTSFINHHVVNIESRIKKYIRVRLGEDTWNAVKKYKLVNKLFRYILWGGDALDVKGVLQGHRKWLAYIKMKYEDYVASRKGVFQTSESIKVLIELTYWLGMQLEKMQRVFVLDQHSGTHIDKEIIVQDEPLDNDDDIDNQHDVDNSKASDVVESSQHQLKKTWTIAPICSIKRQYVTLGSCGLDSLMRDHLQKQMNEMDPKKIPWQLYEVSKKKPLKRKIALVESSSKKRKVINGASMKEIRSFEYTIPAREESGKDLWEAVFSSQLLNLKKKRHGWEFGKYVRTDGVALCSTFRNDRQEMCILSKKKKLCECRDCQKASFDVTGPVPSRLVAIDPGCANIFYAVEQTPESIKTWKYTCKQYYSDGRIFQARDRMNLHMALASKAFSAVRKARKKTVHLQDQLKYWKACMDYDTKLWLRLFSRSRAKMSFATYKACTSALDRKFGELRDGGQASDVLVAYGAGLSGHHSHRGTLTAPTSKAYKRARRMYRILLIDEYYTSQMCPYCGMKLREKMMPHIFRNGRKGYIKVRSVKLCSSQSCVERAKNYDLSCISHLARTKAVRELSRDKLAAINIWTCARVLIDDPDHQARPAYLCRPSTMA